MVNHLHEVQRSGQRITTYCTPTSLQEALELLAAGGKSALLIAGGTDVLVELDRGGRPGIDTLIDLSRIEGLAQIHHEDDMLHLGPLVTHNQVVASSICRTLATPLAQACWEVGSPQLRNRATVAGNVVTASPANDTISALLALGATIELTSPRGVRSMPVVEFITGFRTTLLSPDELVSETAIPTLGADQRGIFVKLGLRRAQAISVIHLASTVTLDDDDIVTAATIAIGSVGPTVLLIDGGAKVLRGRPLDAEAISAAAAVVTEAVSPIDDLRASATYRRRTTTTVTRRALQALAQNRQLETWPQEPPLLWGDQFDGRFPPGPVGRTTLGPDETIITTVNGQLVTAAGATEPTLLDWLRDHAGTNGVKEGCAEGECGACTIFLDGAAVMACLVPAARAHGANVVTVEGLADGERLHPLQQAFVDDGAVQCGFCTPGFLMAASKLLDEHPHPTRDQVAAGLAGNLCRCTGYNSIHQAVQSAAAVQRAAAVQAGVRESGGAK